MNEKPTHFLSLLILVMVLPDTSIALGVGDKAPPWKLAEWTKGAPVMLTPGSNIYVLYFFETTCKYCPESAPVLNELKKKYTNQGLIPFGISYEPANVVKAYVDRLGNELDCSIAIDDKRQTYDAYMLASDVVAVPYAFVINANGILAWHGNPLGGLEEAVEELVSGRFDLEAWQKVFHAARLFKQYLKLVSTNPRQPDADQIGGQILAEGSKDPRLMNNFAWSILTSSDVKDRDLELALKAAKAAYGAAQGKQPSLQSGVADTYAKALCETGQLDEAVKMQKRAIELCQEPPFLLEMKRSLDFYQTKLLNPTNSSPTSVPGNQNK